MKKRAKEFIKDELKKRKLTYIMLSNIMKEKGYNYTDNTIRTKVNRGSYSFVFLLEVCDSLDLNLIFEEINEL
jgi:ribose 5-phosphate isomerase RpiB